MRPDTTIAMQDEASGQIDVRVAGTLHDIIRLMARQAAREAFAATSVAVPDASASARMPAAIDRRHRDRHD